MSALLNQAHEVPLVEGADRVIRVAGTRVTLETIAAAFDEGATAEEIVQQYPSLLLSDIYDVLSYVLRHRTRLHDYLSRRDAERTALRVENARRFSAEGLRARLLARHNQ